MSSNKSERTAQVARERILEQLKSVGGKGFTKTAIAKNKSEKQALEELVGTGKVANLGSEKSSYYVFVGQQSVDSLCLSLAISAVKGLTEAGRPRLVAKSEIEKRNKLPAKARGVVAQALKNLVDERLLIPLKAGSSNYFLSVASLRGYFPDSTVPPPPIQTPFDPAAARLAYRRLVEELRSPEVLIADLAEASLTPLKPLQEWLLSECRAQRAVPGRGEPTVATPRQLECALLIDREPYLYIKFLE